MPAEPSTSFSHLRTDPWTRARTVAVANNLNIRVAQRVLTHHVDTTRAWLAQPATAMQAGARVAVAWVLEQRRRTGAPTTASVFALAGVVDLHPQPAPRPGQVDIANFRDFVTAWRQVIIDETAEVLTTAHWLAPVDDPETIILGRAARNYLARRGIVL